MSIKTAKQSLTRNNTVDKGKTRSEGDSNVFDGNYDPYYSSVAFHLGDSDVTTNTLMTDWSANKWDNMYNATAYIRMDGRIPSTMGPRSQHWCTEYSYNGYHTYADTPQLRFGYNNFTIEFWIKLQKQSASEIYVMSKGAGLARATGGTGWLIGINASYQPFFWDGLTNVATTSTTALNRDTWYHVAVVRSTTAASGLKIYIGGTLVATGTSASNFNDTGTLKIGRDRDATVGATSFWGLMTDLRIQTKRIEAILSGTDTLNRIGLATTLGVSVNDPVVFTGTSQGGIVIGQVYYVQAINVVGVPGNISISSTPGGAAVTLTTSFASSATANFSYTPATPTLPTAALDMTGANVVLSQSMLVGHYTDNLGRMTHSTDCTRRIDSPFYVHSEQTGHGVGCIASMDKNSWLKVYDAIPSNTSLRFGTGNFTVEAWVCFQANYAINNSICGKGTTGWTFGLNTSGYLQWTDNATTVTATETRNRISAGGWYHIAAVRSSTSAGGFNMYVNGLLVYSGTLATNYTDTDPLYLFVDKTAVVVGCSGMICGLAISTIARYTPSAVTTGVTATDATGIITCVSTAGFVAGDKVTFRGTQGGITATTYWIFQVLDGTRFTISSTQGGAQFVTTTSSASGVLTASLTAQFIASGTSFIDAQMTVDANHSLLIGTCGSNPVINNQPAMLDKGQGRMNFIRSGNEMRLGGVAPYSRHGYSLWFRNGTQNQMKAFVATGNTNDFTFGTNNFSIEFWISNFRLSNETQNISDILLDTRLNWNDTGIRIRKCSGLGFDVLTSGKVVLTSANNRFTEFPKTVNGGPLWGTKYAPNGLTSPRVWTHLCVQRTSNNLALYVNGTRVAETFYSTAINTPLSKIILGNSNWTSSATNNNYDQGFYGWMSDIRICNGSSAYGADSKNPPTIPVPTAPLPTITNCVLLLANTSSYLRDQSGRGNRIAFEQTNANGASTWEVRHLPTSPYQGVDFNSATQLAGHSWDTTGSFISSGSNARYNHTSNYNDLFWINRMTGPWTIEGWFWIYQTGDYLRTTSVETRQILSNADTAGYDGFQIMWNVNSSGATAFGDLTMILWNNNAPQAQYLGSTGGLAANQGEGYFRPYTHNHFAFQYDPSATNKMAVFINGNRVAVRAAFTASTSTSAGTTYALSLLPFISNIRISKTARYNNDATTYTVPTSVYPIDQYTWTQPVLQLPIINDKKLQATMYGPYGCMLSPYYKKFGNGAIKLPNRDANTDSDIAKFAKINIPNGGGNVNGNALTVRDGDYTIECWAAWHSTSNGGVAFSSAGYGNFLFTVGATYSVGVNASGYWKMQHVQSHLDSEHWIYNVGQSPYVNTQTPYTATAGYGYQLYQTNVLVAQPTVASPNTFDHIVFQRKLSCFYLYINGVEMAIMYGNGNSSYGQTSNTLYAPISDLTPYDQFDARIDVAIGGDGAATGGRYWSGWIQDFRATTLARYDTVVIGGVPTMCHAGTEIPALPTKLFPTK
jgi:hypothetical protein